MTARIGYLAALTTGRRDHPPLRPPRRLFPPVPLADAEPVVLQTFAGAESGPWPRALEPSAASPGTALPGTPAPGTGPPEHRQPAEPTTRHRSGALRAVDPGAGTPDAGDSDGAAYGTSGQLPEAPGQRGRPEAASLRPAIHTSLFTQPPGGSGAEPDLAGDVPRAGSLPGARPAQAPGAAPDRPQVRRTANVKAGRTGRTGMAAAESATGTHPDLPALSLPEAGPSTVPAPGRTVAQAAPGQFRTQHPPAAPHDATGAAAPGPPGAQAVSLADPPASRPDAWSTAAGHPDRYPPSRSAATEHGLTAAVADARTPHQQPSSERRQRTAAVADARTPHQQPPSERRQRTARRMTEATETENQDQPAAQWPSAGNGAGQHRRQAAARTAPGDATPSTLSIGTIEITVLPPTAPDPLQDRPPQASPPRTAPVLPPGRLSRGLGPWFGQGQA